MPASLIKIEAGNLNDGWQPGYPSALPIEGDCGGSVALPPDLTISLPLTCLGTRIK